MSLDPDILMFVLKGEQDTFHQDGFKSINQLYEIDDIKRYQYEQFVRQVLLFSRLLKSGARTQTELIAKIKPYLNTSLVRAVVWKVISECISELLFASIDRYKWSTIARYSRLIHCRASHGQCGCGFIWIFFASRHAEPTSLTDVKRKTRGTVEDYARIFVKHCNDIKHFVAERAVLKLGGVEDKDFIKKLNDWTPKGNIKSPFRSGDKPPMPANPYSRTYEKMEKKAKDRTSNYQRTSRQEKDSEVIRLRVPMWVIFDIDDTVLMIVCRCDALCWYDTDEERLHALNTYGEDPIRHMICAYLSFNKETKLTPMCFTGVSRDARVRALLKIVHTNIDTSLGDFSGTDLFGEEVWKLIEVNHGGNIGFIYEVGPTLAKPDRAKEAQSDSAFWREQARAACLRQFGFKNDLDKIQELVVIFAQLFEDYKRACCICHCPLVINTWGEEYDKPSIDRIVPGVRNGKYTDKKNLQVTCIGCQDLKYWYRMGNSLKLIRVAATALWRKTAAGDWLDPTVVADKKPMESNDLKQIILPWIKAKRTRTIAAYEAMIKNGSGKKLKPYTLDDEDVVALIGDRYIGNGWIEDVAGVRAPLALMSLDRIDQNKGYEKGNVRLLLIGLNILRGHFPNDIRIIQYLQYLRDHVDDIKYDPERSLPLEQWVQSDRHQFTVLTPIFYRDTKSKLAGEAEDDDLMERVEATSTQHLS